MAITVSVEDGTITFDIPSDDIPNDVNSFRLRSLRSSTELIPVEVANERVLRGAGIELSIPERDSQNVIELVANPTSSDVEYYHLDIEMFARGVRRYTLQQWRDGLSPQPDPVPEPSVSTSLNGKLRRKRVSLTNLDRDAFYVHTTGLDFATGVFTLGNATVPVRAAAGLPLDQNSFKSYNNPAVGNRAAGTGYALGAFVALDSSVTEYQYFRVKGRIVATGSSTTLVGFLFCEATVTPTVAAAGFACRYVHLDSAIGTEVLLDDVVAFKRPSTSPGPAVGLAMFTMNMGSAARPPRTLGTGSIQSLGVSPPRWNRAVS